MSTRPLDLRGGWFRFVSLELPDGRPTLFKSANGLLKSLTLDLFSLATQCPCLSEEHSIRVFVQQPWSDVVEYHHEMNVRPENRSCL